MGHWSFRPYVPVARRREQAAREIEKLRKKGRDVSPVVIEGRKIARSFWGKAWCGNLERYCDFESRLPRGQSYVRNGSIIDLKIARGSLRALVSGSEIYKVNIDIAVAASARWKAICRDCAGSIGSLVELLQGKLSQNVMERVCREGDGLFPSTREIRMSCSCPDWADMCKHAAAALYGVGARLDAAPELLFTLRGVDQAELIAAAGADLPIATKAVASDRILADEDVAALFGVDMAAFDAPPVAKRKKQGSPIAGEAPLRARQPASRREEKKAPPGSGAAGKRSAGADAASNRNRKQKEPDSAARMATAAPASPAAKPKAGRRWRDGAPAGRTRAAKWIGAKARKARQ